MKQKYSILFFKTPLSEAEILPYKDFDGLLKKRALIIRQKKIWRKVALSTVALTAVLCYLYNFSKLALQPQPEKDKIESKTHQPAIQPEPKKQRIAHKNKSNNLPGNHIQLPKLTRANAKAETKPAKKAAEKPVYSQTEVRNKLTQTTSNNNLIKADIAPDQTEANRLETTTEVVENTPSETKASVVNVIPATEAAPKAGFSALYTFFARELRYPESAVINKVNGVVLVGFTINEKGQTENIQVIRGLTEDCDTEALRLVQTMPLWYPATEQGKPVKTKLSIPIRFQIIKD